MNRDVLGLIVRLVPEMSVLLEMTGRGLKEIVDKISLRGYAAIRARDYVGMKKSNYAYPTDAFNVAAKYGSHAFARRMFEFVLPSEESRVVYSAIRCGLVDIAKQCNITIFKTDPAFIAGNIMSYVEASIRNGTEEAKRFMMTIVPLQRTERCAEIAILHGTGKETYIDPLGEEFILRWHIFQNTEESRKYVKDYNWEESGKKRSSYQWDALSADNYELLEFFSETDGLKENTIMYIKPGGSKEFIHKDTEFASMLDVLT
jgi:hypothetical protein